MPRDANIPLGTALVIGATATLAISSMAIGFIEYRQSGGKRGSFRPLDYVLITASLAYTIYQGGDISKGLDTWQP